MLIFNHTGNLLSLSTDNNIPISYTDPNYSSYSNNNNMSCIRFKFKSSLEYDKVTFDGLQLSVGELRKKIMTLKKLGVSDDFTLQIMDAQSKKSQLRTLPYNWRGWVLDNNRCITLNKVVHIGGYMYMYMHVIKRDNIEGSSSSSSTSRNVGIGRVL